MSGQTEDMLRALESAPDGLTLDELHAAVYGDLPPWRKKADGTYYRDTSAIRSLLREYRRRVPHYARVGVIVAGHVRGRRHRRYHWLRDSVTYRLDAPRGVTRIIVETEDDALVYRVEGLECVREG